MLLTVDNIIIMVPCNLRYPAVVALLRIAGFNSYKREFQNRVEVLLIHFGLWCVSLTHTYTTGFLSLHHRSNLPSILIIMYVVYVVYALGTCSVAFILVDSYKYRTMDFYQMASALRTMDRDTFSREISSFGESDLLEESVGPEKVPRAHDENWSHVLEDIVARKKIAKKKSKSITGPSAGPMSEDDIIAVPRKFYSSSGIIVSAGNQQAQNQHRNVAYTSVDGGNKRVVRTKGSTGAINDGGGEVISVQRGQSAVQLRTYRPAPKSAAAPEGRVIVARKGTSASGIRGLKAFSLPDTAYEDTVIAAPRFMSAANIGAGKRRSFGPADRVGSAGRGERVVEKILVRRKKTDPKVAVPPVVEMTAPPAQEASSVPSVSSAGRLMGILERRESVEMIDTPPGSPMMKTGKSIAAPVYSSSDIPSESSIVSNTAGGDAAEEVDDGNAVIKLTRSSKL
jgi:hypothetical protein